MESLRSAVFIISARPKTRKFWAVNLAGGPFRGEHLFKLEKTIIDTGSIDCKYKV